jgi:hypothetical protein
MKGTGMKNAVKYLAAFLFAAYVLTILAWIVGYNFDGTWSDPFEYDHPENFTRAQ